jgi:hypothetical protein
MAARPQRGDRFGQRLRIERLVDHADDAGSGAHRQCLRLRPGGHEDRRRSSGRRQAPQRRQCRRPVHAGHHYIEQQEIGREAGSGFDRRGAGGAGEHDEAAAFLQRRAGNRLNQRLILDAKNFLQGRHAHRTGTLAQSGPRL